MAHLLHEPRSAFDCKQRVGLKTCPPHADFGVGLPKNVTCATCTHRMVCASVARTFAFFAMKTFFRVLPWLALAVTVTLVVFGAAPAWLIPLVFLIPPFPTAVLGVCDTPLDAFRIATEYLPNDIYKRASWRDIAMNLVPRGMFTRGKGITHSVFTVGRSFPTTDLPDFEQIELTEGALVDPCSTTYQDVPVGLNEDTYGPEKFGWKGPVICQDKLIYEHNTDAFLMAYIQAITKNTIQTINNRLFAIYDHYVPKFIANETAENEVGGTGHPPQDPLAGLTLAESECELTQEMLDSIAAELNEEGATEPNSNGWITLGDDGPAYPLQIGQLASKRIQLNNAELREDYRQAYSTDSSLANPFLKRIGATRVIGNFRHVINLFPPRYTYAGGTYVRVPTWIMPAGTKGQVGTINPAWRTAPFEGARVLSPWVFHDEIVQPVNSSAGISFPYKTYMGDWKFIVGGNNIATTHCFDPLGKYGAHFAEYHHAAKPIFPIFGRLIIFRRCALGTFECPTCS